MCIHFNVKEKVSQTNLDQTHTGIIFFWFQQKWNLNQTNHQGALWCKIHGFNFKNVVRNENFMIDQNDLFLWYCDLEFWPMTLKGQLTWSSITTSMCAKFENNPYSAFGVIAFTPFIQWASGHFDIVWGYNNLPTVMFLKLSLAKWHPFLFWCQCVNILIHVVFSISVSSYDWMKYCVISFELDQTSMHKMFILHWHILFCVFRTFPEDRQQCLQ